MSGVTAAKMSELLISKAAVAGEQDRAHDGRNCHSARLSPNWFKYHCWNLITLPS